MCSTLDINDMFDMLSRYGIQTYKENYNPPRSGLQSKEKHESIKSSQQQPGDLDFNRFDRLRFRNTWQPTAASCFPLSIDNIRKPIIRPSVRFNASLPSGYPK
jgi:hypothetical protein